MSYGDSEAAIYDGPEARLRPDKSRSLAGRQERVEKELAGLSALADEMEGRLAPVLGPHRPTPTDGALRSRDADDTAPLSAWLDETAGRLSSTASRLSYLMERVEL